MNLWLALLVKGNLMDEVLIKAKRHVFKRHMSHGKTGNRHTERQAWNSQSQSRVHPKTFLLAGGFAWSTAF